jgi:hypothetical protein
MGHMSKQSSLPDFDSITALQPVTISIDPALHSAMKLQAKTEGLHVSFLYSRLVEEYLSSIARNSVIVNNERKGR